MCVGMNGEVEAAQMLVGLHVVCFLLVRVFDSERET